MRSWYAHQSWSPQRLIGMLKDAQTREKESWRGSLISKTSDLASEITSKQRDAAVQWLIHLNNRFNFHPETFFLAVHILDRFLTAVKCRPKYMKCLCVSSLYIACKILEEEEDIPTTSQLVLNSDCGCRRQDIHRMERIVLTKLEWNLHTPTPYTYLQIFYNFTHRNMVDGKEVPLSKRSRFALTHHFATLALELQHILCNYSTAPFPSSALALALISLDMEKHPSESLTMIRKLQSLAKVTTPDLISCRVVLLSMAPQRLAPQRWLPWNPNFNNLFSQLDCQRSVTPHTMDTVVFQEPNLATPLKSCPEVAKKKTQNRTGLEAPCNDTVMKQIIQARAVIPHDNDDLYDSDKTMSASEGEEEKEEELEKPKIHLRPLSYADIVKFGVLESKKSLEDPMHNKVTPERDELASQAESLNLFKKIFGFPEETPEPQLMVTTN